VIRELSAGALAIALSCAVEGIARAQTEKPTTPRAPLVFVYDPKLGMEAGIRSADSLGRILFRYDEAIPRFIDWNEKTVLGAAGAIVGRTLQYALVDDALASIETVIIHEVFGHGARARAFGQEVKFDFPLPGYYCVVLPSGDNCTAHTQVTTSTGARDHDLAVDMGGVEANLLTGYWIDMRIMQSGGWVHQGDLLVYFASKTTYMHSFLSTKLDIAGGLETPSDDIDRYVTLLQDRFNLPRPEDRHRISSRLRTAYLWNLADPMLLYSFYGVTYRGIGRGERITRVPFPTIGDTMFYAAPRFNLTPFGAEHYVDVFLGRRSRSAERGGSGEREGEASVLSVYGRAGSSGLASYTGAGARVMGVRVHDRLAVGGELDVWSQPEVLVEERNVYERPQIRGMNVGASVDIRVIDRVGITGKLAYKTRGYLAGQPLDDGPYGYFGLSIAPF
jgi:hypothetical protein